MILTGIAGRLICTELKGVVHTSFPKYWNDITKQVRIWAATSWIKLFFKSYWLAIPWRRSNAFLNLPPLTRVMVCCLMAHVSWNFDGTICGNTFWWLFSSARRPDSLLDGNASVCVSVCLSVTFLYPRSTEGGKGVYWIHPDVCPSVCPSVRL